MRGVLKKLPIDTYMLLLIATVVIATVLPVSGSAARFVSHLSSAAVALLFFLYGAKLKAQAIVAGISNWKLQLLVVFTTYVVFPILGFGLAFFASSWLPEELVVGFLFLCILPSTVQSSIALTGMARGNVPAAICAASLSNVLSVVLTPAFAAVLLSTSGIKLDANAVIGIFVQLLLPFVAGQLLRPLIGAWIERNRMLTMAVDRGSILLIIYSAFSAGVVGGIWGRLDGMTLSLLIGLDLILLLLVMVIVRRMGQMAGLSREDEVSLLFCGSQKSLANGVPMVNILFAGHATGLIILPLMLYHQFQLFVCAAIAQRYAAGDEHQSGVREGA
ncbi:bile acid:sodium symporter [Hoeflea sp. G2-23]|uniref:Bile acid:sodium symporter n=1 Tax=Hoeflea algicola TaxID=2983763 RepID=A0ABT3Z8R6_9HYPH|nr:bile acid:sodium symporter family protein [Hoeflea algicola]MCY0148168.1 bile acid:sodium symporter [Hoeflea algicola]